MNAVGSVHDDAVRDLVALDPSLGPVARAVGPLPERPGLPGFAGLAGVVVAQLVSRASADAIWARLVAAAGPLTPESYLAIAQGRGPRLGLTAAKADTLVRVAEAVLAGSLDLDGLAGLGAEDAVGQLTAIKGIGSWTAEVHLLFNCGHFDIFPAGDLALRIAYGSVRGMAERPEAQLLRARASAWAPLRSTAARLFWAYYGAVLRKGGSMPAPPL